MQQTVSTARLGTTLCPQVRVSALHAHQAVLGALPESLRAKTVLPAITKRTQQALCATFVTRASSRHRKCRLPATLANPVNLRAPIASQLVLCVLPERFRLLQMKQSANRADWGPLQRQQVPHSVYNVRLDSSITRCRYRFASRVTRVVTRPQMEALCVWIALRERTCCCCCCCCCFCCRLRFPVCLLTHSDWCVSLLFQVLFPRSIRMHGLCQG